MARRIGDGLVEGGDQFADAQGGTAAGGFEQAFPDEHVAGGMERLGDAVAVAEGVVAGEEIGLGGGDLVVDDDAGHHAFWTG